MVQLINNFKKVYSNIVCKEKLYHFLSYVHKCSHSDSNGCSSVKRRILLLPEMIYFIILPIVMEQARKTCFN